MCKKNMSNSPDKNNKIKCPLCRVGHVELPVTAAAKRAAVLTLHEAGLSVRVIQTALSYKSPRSVHRIIQRYKKSTVD